MSPYRILIVEPNRTVRNALHGALAAWGYKCVTLDHERKLFECLETERPFDLLIVDPMLPMIDLPTTMKSLRDKGLSTGVILLLNEGDADDSWLKIFPDARAMIERPDGGPHLQDIIRKAIGRSEEGPQSETVDRLRDQYEALFDISPNLIVLYDQDRRILDFNARLQSVLKADKSTLVGRECHEALCDGSHPAEECPLGRSVEQNHDDGASRRVELFGRYFDVRSVPMFDRNGRLWGGMDLLHDVSSLVEAEQAVRRRLEVERLVVDISSEFVRETDPDRMISRTLERIGTWSGAARSFLFQFSDDGMRMDRTHEWCAPGVESRLDDMRNIPASRYLWLMAQLVNHRTLHVDDVTKMPAEALAEQQLFSSSKVRSFVAFPVHVGDRVGGFLGLDAIDEQHVWTPEDRAILRMLSEVIGNAMERHRADMQQHILATAIEQLSELIMITRMGTIYYVNSAFEQITGRTRTSVIGRRPRDIFYDAQQPDLIDRVETRVRRRKAWQGTGHFRRSDEGAFDLSFTVCPVFDHSGRLLHTIVIGRDITEQLKIETQLRNAQKLESIGQLAAGIAHEINTPIQFVGDNTRFLKDCFNDVVDVMREMLAVIEESTCGQIDLKRMATIQQRLIDADIEYLAQEIPSAIEQTLEGVERVARIVHAMKDFSHPGSPHMSLVDLNRAIESTVEICRNEWKYVAEMVLDLQPDLPHVLCLPAEFNQAILNLVINASHVVREKMEATGTDQKGTITLRSRQVGDTVVVEVQDTGTGIPAEYHDRLFDPFFTTKKVGRGTGQGLAIVFSVIVEKHKGTIDFTTELGVGTTFRLSIPLKGRADAPLETADEPEVMAS